MAGTTYTNPNGLSAPTNQSGGFYASPLTQASPNNTGGYTSVGANNIAWGVATPDEYTSNQLNSLVSQNSPYLQQARLQATQAANARGLGNSSIAAGNAQAAAIQAALPIATNDANMLANLQKTNLTDAAQQNSAFRQAEATENAAGQYASATVQAENTRAAEALQAQREQDAFSGEQTQLQDQFNAGQTMQQYYNTSGLSAQQFQQQYGLQQFQDQFNLGANLLQGQENFYNTAGLSAMNNPAIMGDPQAFGGYMQFISNPFSQTIDSIFGNLFGNNSTSGGTP